MWLKHNSLLRNPEALWLQGKLVVFKEAWFVVGGRMLHDHRCHEIIIMITEYFVTPAGLTTTLFPWFKVRLQFVSVLVRFQLHNYIWSNIHEIVLWITVFCLKLITYCLNQNGPYHWRNVMTKISGAVKSSKLTILQTLTTFSWSMHYCCELNIAWLLVLQPYISFTITYRLLISPTFYWHHAKKATIHQVTTMLATSKNVLFPGHNHLLTTSADDPSL